eukprot:1470387-Amphidinium_carterae.1
MDRNNPAPARVWMKSTGKDRSTVWTSAGKGPQAEPERRTAARCVHHKHSKPKNTVHSKCP